jgi:hypothetical protein
MIPITAAIFCYCAEILANHKDGRASPMLNLLRFLFVLFVYAVLGGAILGFLIYVAMLYWQCFVCVFF